MVPAEGGTVRAALMSLDPALRGRILDEGGGLRPYLNPATPGAPLETVPAAEGG
jgi:hypothetical protein